MLTIDQLKDRIGEVHDLGQALSLLHWDQETQMPRGAAEARARQISTLSGHLHRLATAKDIGEALRHFAADGKDLAEDDRLMVREALWDHDRATKLPEDFVREESELTSKAHFAWVDARKADDFDIFRPYLERIVDLCRRKADLYGFEGSPYNGLLAGYERGMTAEALKPLFAELATRQKNLIARIAASPRQPDRAWLDQKWPIDAQEAFSRAILEQMTFDFDHGRLDVAAHPFCTSFSCNDVRLTTRYSEDDLFSSLYSAMHEGGHGLYERGLDEHWNRTPLGDSVSLGIHESQSRMWENMIGRSRPFWKHNLPALKKAFPGMLDHVTVDQAYACANTVRPSLIRVEADECTYNLHIIIRFEIELELLEGRLAPKDIPELWNAKYKDYLGLDVPSNALGCLQDIHWSMGGLGYFPTYTLGNLYAAQLFEAILRDIPDLDDRIEAGDLKTLREWLRTQIHLPGRRMTAPQLIEKVTGQRPTHEPYMRYLETKFGQLYNL